MQDFQNFIRAGLKDETQKFLEGQSVDVLKSKFYIDMRFDEKQHDKDVQRDDVHDSTMNEQLMENGGIELKEADQCLELTKGFNTRMTINALHLAIFSRQLESVRCLLNHIFESNLEEGKLPEDVINDVIGEKVTLDYGGCNQESFSYYDRCLHGMNALHLSCHYYSKAIELIFDTMFKNNISCPNMEEIVNDKNNILQFAPLHIAAKKSLITASR